MTNPFPAVPDYGMGPYPYTLRVIVPWGVGMTSHIDVSLSRFPKDEGGAPDPLAIKNFCEEQYAASPFELDFQIIDVVGESMIGSTLAPDMLCTITGRWEGTAALNAYLNLDIELVKPPPS